MAVDLLGIAQAGQSLVGDLGEQLFRDDQRRQQNQVQALKLKLAQDTQTRQVAFRAEVQSAIQSGDPRAIGRLMALYPEFADQIKPGWEALSADARRANLTQTGIIYKRAMNGDAKGAAAMLRQRYEADLAAGQNDETTKEILDALEGGDPQAIKVAIGSLGMMIAADDPSKFGDVYGKLNPTDATTTVQKEYQWRVGQFGQQAADRWLAVQDTKLVPVQAGGAVFDAADLVQATPRSPSDVGGVGDAMSDELNRRGGDQSTGGRGIAPTGQAIESAALTAVPGLTVTSRQRSPGKNASVGGVGGSYHLTDQARDFVPPKGMGMGSLRDRLKQVLPGFDVINEGDHVHVEPSVGTAHTSSPVRVRSVQEARKLPSGTIFTTPDGRTMRKP